jgi:hypothetical protein
MEPIAFMDGNRVKMITFGFVLSWFIGVLALISGFIYLSYSVLTSILFFLISFVVLPPFNNLVEKKLHFRISGVLKFVTVVILLTIIGITIPQNILQDIHQNVTANIQEKTQSQSGTDQQNSDLPKTYIPIYLFEGEGPKKSEPFTVKSDSFKVAYDCQGSLCSATLYKLNDDFPVQLIMNTSSSTKDETIVYGEGTYYIDATVMGKFSMTIYEYTRETSDIKKFKDYTMRLDNNIQAIKLAFNHLKDEHNLGDLTASYHAAKELQITAQQSLNNMPKEISLQNSAANKTLQDLNTCVSLYFMIIQDVATNFMSLIKGDNNHSVTDKIETDGIAGGQLSTMIKTYRAIIWNDIR